LCEPQDDSARLVFADWLEEHNDPRGPLLRVIHAVRRAAGPYEPITAPQRSKIRDSADPLVIHTGPMPIDWVWPYPTDKPPPDVTKPKIDVTRGVHGSGRLLSMAMVLELLETFRSYGNHPEVRTCLAALELADCRLITSKHRDYVIGTSALFGPGYKGAAEFARAIPAELKQYGYNANWNLFQVVRNIQAARQPIDFCMGARFGSFVNAAQTIEVELRRKRSRVVGSAYIPARQLEWHLRMRTLRMVDAWKALTPWLDGNRVWIEMEEAKQNGPPTSNSHKAWQVSCKKYPCDHTLINGKSAYITKTIAEPPYGTGRVRNSPVCCLCGHERPRALRP